MLAEKVFPHVGATLGLKVLELAVNSSVHGLLQ